MCFCDGGSIAYAFGWLLAAPAFKRLFLRLGAALASVATREGDGPPLTPVHPFLGLAPEYFGTALRVPALCRAAVAILLAKADGGCFLECRRRSINTVRTKSCM